MEAEKPPSNVVETDQPPTVKKVLDFLHTFLPPEDMITPESLRGKELYFAYGASMDEERMKERGVEPERVLFARLPDYELVFDKKSSKPGVGFANIRPQDPTKKKSRVEGVVFVIPEEDVIKLDKFEGAPNHYRRTQIKVRLGSGKVVDAITYIANPEQVREGLRPSQEYMERVLKAAKKYLPFSYQRRLKNIETFESHEFLIKPEELNGMAAYFAYGSNMALSQMERRKTQVMRSLHAILPHYKLSFNKVARKGGEGYANVIEDNGEKAWVEGVIHIIPVGDLAKLDYYEGYPREYDRKEVGVRLDNGDVVQAVVYMAVPGKTDDSLKPSKSYMSRILEAEPFLTPQYFKQLSETQTID